MAAHGVFHDLIIFAAAEQDADAGVFVRALAVAIKRLQIKGELARCSDSPADARRFIAVP